MKRSPRVKNNPLHGSDVQFSKRFNCKTTTIPVKSTIRFFISAMAVLCSLFVFQLEALALSVSLSWSPSTSDVDGYRIYYKDGVQGGQPYNGTHANEGNSPLEIGNATRFTISGLETGRNYYFVITAYKGNVESSYSNEVCLFGGPVIKSIKTNR